MSHFFWTKILSVQICVRVSLPHLCTCVHCVQVLCSTSTSNRYVTFFFEQKFTASKCPSKSASGSLYPIYVLASTASKSYVVCPRPNNMSHFFWTKILSVQMSVQICVRVSLPHLYTCVHCVQVLCSTSTSKWYVTFFFEQKFSASKCPSKSASGSLYSIYILASTASKSYVVRPRPKDMSHFFWTKILSVQMSVQICVRVSLPHLCTCVHSVQVLCSTSTSKWYVTFFLNKNSQRPNVRPNLRPGLSTPFMYLRPQRPSLM